MKLIVGLGNPGSEYNKTRHNVGFMALDAISQYYGFTIEQKKFDGLYSQQTICNEKIIFLKPQKYINLSGEVIKKYIDYFKIDLQDVLIIHDDMDLVTGTFKIRYKGGSAGHNGLKNIENHLKTQEYKRIKIGISKNKQIDTVDYVLGYFNDEDTIKLKQVLEKIPEVIANFLDLSFENLMNKYNI